MNLMLSRSIVACAVAALVLLPAARAQAPAPAGAAPSQATSEVFKKEQIEQLVAPIALYPDALIAQILMASTYPLEIVSAARWSKANPSVKDKALEDAMQKETWDESVKSLAAFPQVLAMMNEKLDMTQQLGDAFLAQQKDVLDAIQRLRGKADQAGNLKSSKEQAVTKEQEAGQTVIKIEPANPQVVYVPTYNPTVVYGTWPYPSYPPYYYYPPGYVAGAAIFSFAVGVAVGNALWGGCNWGRGNVNVNVNRYNSYNRTNIQNSNWQHHSEHRKGAGYRDQGSRDKYGGGQRAGVDSREQFRGRAEQGRQDINRDKGNRAGAGDRGAGASDRMGDRGGAGGNRAGTREAGGFSGAGGGGAQTREASNRGASSRAGSASSHGGRGGARAAGGGGGGARAGGGGGGGRGR